MSPSPPRADGSLASIREAICRRIAAARAGAGCDRGVVHRYQRYANQESALRALYVRGGLLHGWYVTRVGTLTVPDSAGYVRTVHRWRIVGLRALDDPAQLPNRADCPDQPWPDSERSHDQAIESVRAAFLRDDTLGVDAGGCPYVETTTWEGRQGLQVDDSGPAMWCRTLVHMTRCTLVTVCSEAVGGGAELDDLLRAGIAWDLAPPHYDAGDADTDTIGEVADVSDLVTLPGPDPA